MLQDGRVLIVGGFDGASTLTSTDIFDSGADAVSVGPSLATPRAGHTVTTLLDGKVFVAGGANDTAELSTTEVFDPAAEVFSPGAPLAAARQRHQAFLLPHNNSVVIVGGTAGGNSVQLAELYQPWNYMFVPTESPSLGRVWATGSALSFPADDFMRSGPTDGVLLLTGGSASADGAGATRSAELYGFATVNTDRSDYSPGETVTITGSGWRPGEIVALTLVEQPLLDTHPLVPVQADDNGNILSTEFAPDEHDIGIRFMLTAYGSSSQAQTTFTDSVMSVTITSPTSAAPQTITSLPATVTASFSYQTSDTGATMATANILGAGLSNSKSIAPGTGVESVVVTVPAGTANGTYNLRVTVSNSTGTGANQRNDNQNGAVIVNVPSCTTPSITNPTNQTVTYGNNAVFTASATGSPSPTLQWQVSTNSGGSWSNIGGATTSPLTIATPTVSQTGSQYRAEFANSCATVNSTAATLTVNRANAVITVTPYHVTYDAVAHTATGTATGVGGANLSGLDLTGTTHTDAGDYPTDPWTFTDSTGNYNNASGTVHDRIDKANATIDVTGYSGIYDGAAHGASGTATGVGGVDLSAGLSLGAAFTNVPGGTAHWIFAGGINYNDSFGDVPIVIDKASAAIAVTPYSVTYDAAAHTAAGSATGVLGESLSGLDLSGTTHTNAGSYTDSWTFTDATGNYNSTSGTVQDEIAKANAVIEVTPYSVTYNGAAHTATGTARGVLNESLSGLDLSGTTHTNAGDYPADPWIFADITGNYNDATGTVHDEIAKANAVIVVTAYSVTYDAAAHTATGSATGVLGEDLSAGFDLNGTTHTNAGDYPADNWTFAGGVNYNDATGTVHDKIEKAIATVSVSGYTGVYNGNAHGASGTATGVGGVDLSAGLNFGAAFTNVPGGTAHWTFDGGTNYHDQSGDVAITISRANAVIVVTPYHVTYDGTAHTATGTAKGVLNENLSGLSLSGTTHVDAGTYSDTWTFTDVTGNYNDTNGTVTDIIDRRPVTVTADAKTKGTGRDGSPVYLSDNGWLVGEWGWLQWVPGARSGRSDRSVRHPARSFDAGSELQPVVHRCKPDHHLRARRLVPRRTRPFDPAAGRRQWLERLQAEEHGTREVPRVRRSRQLGRNARGRRGLPVGPSHQWDDY